MEFLGWRVNSSQVLGIDGAGEMVMRSLALLRDRTKATLVSWRQKILGSGQDLEQEEETAGGCLPHC